MQHNDVPAHLLHEAAPGARTRRLALAAIAIAVVAGVALAWRAMQPPPLDTGTSPATAHVVDNSFLATPAQFESFRVAPVANHVFRGERLAEGRIAVNQNRVTPVFSPFSGRVLRVLANPGDTVTAGQPLAAVEASEFNQAHNDLLTATASLASARAQARQAQVNEERKRALFEARAGAQQDWQQAQADQAVARAAEKSAETALALARNRLRILGKSEGQIDAMEQSRGIDPVSPLASPIAGTVIDRQVGPGQFIQSGGATPLFTVGDLSTVWLVANVREADAPAMRVGDAVEVRVLALPNRVFRARIAFVGAQVDPATRRLPVRAEVPNPTGELKPEMFASFSIVAPAAERAAPAVPASGVVYEGDEVRVWVVREERRIELRKVRVGRSDGDLVEVVEGLKAGERVVTSGTLFIDREVKRSNG
jgi:cobalt-zinc-cadmium efflux system membrane fusion protein